MIVGYGKPASNKLRFWAASELNISRNRRPTWKPDIAHDRPHGCEHN
jgi:hypothetical protein